MSTLDAKVITEPSGAWNAAQSLTSISTTVSTAGEDISSAHNQVASDCTSETTNAALSSLSSQRSTLDALSTNTTSLATALTAFGNSMNSIKTRLAQVVADAAAAELVVSGSTIHSPDDTSDEKYETKKAKFDELKETLYLIRQDESSAHDTLISACDSLKSAGEWFRDKYLPTGTVADFSKAAGWANRLSIGTRWGAIGSIARFQPRYPAGYPGAGRFMSAADRSKMGLLRTLWAKTKPENWINKPYTRGTTAWKAQQAVTKVAPALKWVGHASTALTAGLAGAEQYQKDSANPSMGEAEKITRASTQAVTQGGGGWGGAWLGAQAGMTIGAVGGPVGVAVGGIVGGALGGLAGSTVGKMAGDLINKGVSKLFHW
mgnify:CR=1 FL=1